jgi:hypothetical protein
MPHGTRSGPTTVFPLCFWVAGALKYKNRPLWPVSQLAPHTFSPDQGCATNQKRADRRLHGITIAHIKIDVNLGVPVGASLVGGEILARRQDLSGFFRSMNDRVVFSFKIAVNLQVLR